jgi:acyl-CoA synthetase (AMP-forming)/AMP-acid ligase II
MSPAALQTVHASSRRWASLGNGTPAPHELTYPQLIARRAAQLADRELVVDSSVRYTFGQFEHEMMRAARAAIAAGVVPGDRVAIWAPNSVRWLVAAMGASAAGAVLVPMNTRFKGLEAADAVDRVAPRLLFTVRSFLGTDYPAMLRAAVTRPLGTRIVVLDAGAEAPDLTWEEFTAGGEAVPPARAGAVRDSISAQAPSDIILTSGTTGHPKGVITRHDQNVLALIRYIEHLGLVDGERAYVTLPFFHNFGLKAGFVVSVMLGGACVCDAVFDTSRLARFIEQERISYLPGTPTVFSSLLDDPARTSYDLSSLERCFVAGSMLSVELVARIKKELGSEVFTGYGLSEIAGAVTLTPSGGAPERVTEWAGSVVEGVEVRVIDGSGRDVPHGTEGEILARGDCVMTGYLDDQPATAMAIDAEGWLHTGDIGALDGEGYIKILDRKKDMFIAGGFNVYPAEIEQLLLRHPAIKQVAVVGMPDGRLGEVGAAFVVLAPGESATPDELTGWARLNMSNFKVPRKVTIMDALPMNTSFKVLKGELRKLAAQGR